MKFLRFHKRKSWYFDAGKSISLEVTGCHQTPHVSFRMNGGESEVQFHIACFIGVWLTFGRFIPASWFPKVDTSGYGRQPWGERAFKIYWYEWAIWWNLWMSEDEWNSTDPKWRRNSIHFDRLLKGKHTCKWENLDGGKVLLPFFEGCYEVEVIKKLRIDSYQRWFTRKSISFEVTCEVGVPHMGKGENSYDCGEDATFAISFPGNRTRRNTLYEAALYFWKCCMETRERYGHGRWVPSKYHPLNVNLIEKDGRKVARI